MNAVVEAKGPREIDVVRHQFDQMGDQFKAVLPAHIPVERFARVVMTAIQNNPQLLQAPRKELFNASMKAAQDGLLPDGREGALVLRKSKNSFSITWQPMIAGVRKKARNSGEISTWDAHVVYANDFFQFQLGDAPQINHTYDLKQDRGEPVGAYSVCVLKDGSKSYEVMSTSEINAIRDRSDGWKAFKGGYVKSTPWSTDWAEMARKTVAKRHSKVLPMSTDLDDLIRRDDELYDMKGAKDEAQERRPKSLADRLDQIADETDADPDTGEVIEHESEPSAPSGSDRGRSSSEDSAAGKPPSDISSSPDGGDPISEARRRGAEAREKGMSRKALPKEYRSDERLMSAYLDGFDTGEAEDREPGADEEE
ncbi:MAG: recombinase RecT [Mesorhizobium sp.]|nr:recombinase RecT [Mesorhizobium sp.]MCO5085113.1 recombinase RecT [Rhizobiaceae bacterium]MCO5164633.1 recombinase RecT [Mesorhizobium sp.]